jgi:hypothetical protein
MLIKNNKTLLKLMEKFKLKIVNNINSLKLKYHPRLK